MHMSQSEVITVAIVVAVIVIAGAISIIINWE